MVDPLATTAENGVSKVLLTEFQNSPLSVLPGTSAPLFYTEVLLIVLVSVLPVMSKRADALTGTPPGPVPAPVNVVETAMASPNAIDKTNNEPATRCERMNFPFFARFNFRRLTML